MKVYEYLAAGLPVLSTPLPALEDIADVALAPDAAGFAARLEAVLAQDTPAMRAERSARAASHSWQRRLQEIEAATAEL
jgi:glycosyltransferase involved in cell wall biosynthesis